PDEGWVVRRQDEVAGREVESSLGGALLHVDDKLRNVHAEQPPQRRLLGDELRKLVGAPTAAPPSTILALGGGEHDRPAAVLDPTQGLGPFGPEPPRDVVGSAALPPGAVELVLHAPSDAVVQRVALLT